MALLGFPYASFNLLRYLQGLGEHLMNLHSSRRRVCRPPLPLRWDRTKIAKVGIVGCAGRIARWLGGFHHERLEFPARGSFVLCEIICRCGLRILTARSILLQSMSWTGGCCCEFVFCSPPLRFIRHPRCDIAKSRNLKFIFWHLYDCRW